MDDEQRFESPQAWLKFWEQRWADIAAGRHRFPDFHAITRADRAEAEGFLAYHRSEATRLGFDPDRVVMLRDPVSGDWVVLIPGDQFDAGLSEVW